MILKGPVVLLGAAGAGKTTAGRAAAAKLGVPFVDLDEAAVSSSSSSSSSGARSVDDVFRDEGEASFRARELTALAQELDGKNVVIAAGAGIVDTAPSRHLLQSRATCVSLDVDLAVAELRLRASPRPWLPRDSAGARVAALEAREAPRRPHRRALTAAAVDADRALDVVVADLFRAIESLKPIAPAPLAPDVIFDDSLAFPDDALVVVEDAVARAHENVGAAAGARRLTFAGGEAAKTLANVERIVRALLDAGLTRDRRVVAVGGGAFLDVVGLACSLALRGVRWWAVPTTLLAQADAGVGGKVAVNVDGRKNLLGAFHPAEQTIIARRFRSTLSELDVRAGGAEMLKHEMLAHDAPLDGSALIHDDDVARSLSLKLSVVRRDREERGLRTALNLGHTTAHALEAATRSTTAMGHGEAVRFGLLAMLALSVDHAGLDQKTAAVLAERVRALGPLTAPAVDVDDVLDALRFDKKGAGRFVLLAAPGLPVLATPPADGVAAAVRAALSTT